MKKHYGFTLAEILITVAIAAIIGTLTATSFRTYQIRSDLGVAAAQTKQALARAQLRARLGDHASAWGYHAETGTVFLGTDFATRDTTFDEVISLPHSVTVSGILEMSYSPLYGVPSAVGDIILTSLDGREARVSIPEEYAGIPDPPPRFMVTFDRIDNWGFGSAQATVHVGPSAIEYQEGQWIALMEDGEPLIDDGLIRSVPGLAVERNADHIRIVEYGGLFLFGKEIVDATITFDGATIDHLENSEGSDPGEHPFNGVVSDSVWEDEYTLHEDNTSALFQARVSFDGDTILIFWNPINP